MVDDALVDHGDGFKTAVGVAGKARHRLPVVHVPAIKVGKILPNLATRKARSRPTLLGAGGIAVVVVHTKQKRVLGWPGTRLRQGRDSQDGLP